MRVHRRFDVHAGDLVSITTAWISSQIFEYTTYTEINYPYSTLIAFPVALVIGTPTGGDDYDIPILTHDGFLALTTDAYIIQHFPRKRKNA